MNTQDQPETPKLGRPSKYRPEWCALVVELGRQGKSRCQIAARLDIDAKTLRACEQRQPEFADAMQRGSELAQAWWEDAGQAGIHDRNFNANAFALQVRNRFPEAFRISASGATATVEISGPGGGPIPLKAVRSISRAELEKMAAQYLEDRDASLLDSPQEDTQP